MNGFVLVLILIIFKLLSMLMSLQSVEKTELQADTCSLVSKVLDWLILRSFQIIDNQLESGDILGRYRY